MYKPKFGLAIVFLIASASAFAAPVTYTYVDWTSSKASNASTPGTAAGTLSVGSTAITITYSGDLVFGQTGSGGTNYYVPTSLYTNSHVANVPTNNDLISLSELNPFTSTLMFSKPLLNPILDIVSLGSPSRKVSYNFNAAPTILSQGAGYWGGCNTCLSVSGKTLSGTEGSGVIEFMGSFNSISWTTTGGEYWNGFTLGIEGLGTSGPTPIPEPATLPLFIGAGLVLVSLRRFRPKSARS